MLDIERLKVIQLPWVTSLGSTYLKKNWITGFTTRSHSAESIELMNMKIIFNGFNLHAETIF